MAGYMGIRKGYVSVIGECIGIVIGTAVIVYLLPALPFTTDAYMHWLPVGLTAVIAGGLMKILSHLSPIPFLTRSFRIGDHAVSVYSIMTLLRVYPFDFSVIGIGMLNGLFRFALIVSVFGLLVAALVELVQLITFRPVH